MCGRFGLDIPAPRVAEHYELAEVPDLAPRYNIAPTQPVAAVWPGEDGTRTLRFPRWGLVPAWARDERMASKTFNARAETVTDKPAFREAFRKRRCLIPASGWYEWKKQSDGVRQPYLLRLPDRGIVTFAGLWEPRPADADEHAATCTIITVESAGAAAELHHRMPALLPREAHEAWLRGSSDQALALLAASRTPLRIHPVSPRVNSVANDDATLFAPAAAQIFLPLR